MKKLGIALEYATIAMEKISHLQETVDKINLKLDNHEVRIEILEDKIL